MKKLKSKILELRVTAAVHSGGAIEILVCLLLVTFILFAGLTVDLGNTYVEQLKMRNAVDLAAQAVSERIPADNTVANSESLTAMCERIAEGCGLDIDSRYSYGIQIYANSTEIYAVKLIMTKTVNHYFCAFYPTDSSDIRAGALVTVTTDAAAAHGYTVVVTDVTA